jgi:glycosyltransferase involved in cell wall biosynthesis
VAQSAKMARLSARREQISDSVVHSLPFSEMFSELAKFGGPRFRPLLDRHSQRVYAKRSVRLVREAADRGARLYHYRAGYGLDSVLEAKRLGLFTLCDHSIAHPAVLQTLISSRGDMGVLGERGPMDPMWQSILQDIHLADEVLVNSDFVKRTFVAQGWSESSVHVIYLGVDDSFLDRIPPHSAPDLDRPVRLLFAGGFDERKGADVLVSALTALSDVEWTLEMAAGISPMMRQRHSAFLADRRVKNLGFLSRPQLADRMAQAEMFLFPTFAEGSARVVFEALAAGCYVITTPNSGSIVKDHENGRLVPAGDTVGMTSAVREAASDRLTAFAIGNANAQLVRCQYRQKDYGDQLVALYERLLASKGGVPSA